MDPDTGAASVIATMSISGSGAAVGCAGMAFDPVSEQLYVMATHAAGGMQLGTVNPATGQVSLIGSVLARNYGGRFLL